MELSGIGTTRQWRPVRTNTPTAIENLVKTTITIEPTVGSRSNFFDEFLKAVFHGVAWKRYDNRTAFGRAIPPTTLENQGKRFLTIDPTVGSCSNFFHEFPEAIFDGVAWNQYDKPTASGRVNYTDSAREPGQMVHNYRSDRWIALKFLSRVSGGLTRPKA